MIPIVSLIIIALLLVLNHISSFRRKDKTEDAVDAMKRASENAEKLGISDMTLDEINKEISEARKAHKDS